MGTDVNVNLKAGTKGFDKAVDKSTGKLGKMKELADGLTKASAVAFAGLSASIGLTVREFANFDNELRGVKTLLNQNSFGAKGLEKGFNDLREDILKLGSDSAVGLSELNKALFDTISAGVDASKAISVLEQASKLAVAGLTDVSTATDGITSALGAYGLAAEEAENVASKFFAAQVQGKTTIEELSSSIGLVASTAAASNISLDELLGSVSSLTTAGIKTRTAFTGLKAVISNIAKPTADAAKEAERLNIEFNQTTLREQGLLKFLENLRNANGFTAESITKLFGSVEAQNIAFALTGNQAKSFAENVKQLGKEQENAQTFAEAFSTQNESLVNQFNELTNSIKVAAIRIGKEFEPAVVKGFKAIKTFIDYIAENKALVEFVVTASLGAGAVASLGLAVGSSIKTYVALTTALGTLNAALGTTLTLSTALAAVTGIGALTLAFGAYLKASSDAEQSTKQFNSALGKTGERTQEQTKNAEDLSEALRKVSLRMLGIQETPLIFADEEGAKSFDEVLSKFDDFSGATQRAAEENKAALEKIKADNIAAAEAEKERRAKELQDKKDREQQAFEDGLETLKQQREQKNQLELSDLEANFAAEKAIRDRAAKDDIKIKKGLIKSNKQLEDEDRKRRIGEFNRENALFVKDKLNSNASVAKANAFFRQKEVKQTQEFLGNLSTLQQSNERGLFVIGKLAALSSAIINTAQGATKALAQGGVLGPALAASVVAAGAVQIATIKGQKFQGAKKGGLLEGGVPGQDSIPFFATNKELIAPAKSFEEVIGSVRAKREADRLFQSPTFEPAEPQPVEVMIGFTDDAFEIIEQKLIERRTINVGLL